MEVVRNAMWKVIKNEDNTLTLISNDESIMVTLTKEQLLNLVAIIEGVKNV